MAEVAALFRALQQVSQQVQATAENGRGNGGGRQWDHLDRYKNLKVFDGDSKDLEEWSIKSRRVVNIGDKRVGKLFKAVEHECSEDELAKNKFHQVQPDFDESGQGFVIESSAGMFNPLLNITTSEAKLVVRRSLESWWLAWKRLTSPLNLHTLASGIQAILVVVAPPRVLDATKADQVLDEREDKLVKLGTEYGQELTAKVKVAVLNCMMQKGLQDKVLDACAVNWDETTESEAGQLYTKIKVQMRNIAKVRRGDGRTEADGSGPGGSVETTGGDMETVVGLLLVVIPWSTVLETAGDVMTYFLHVRPRCVNTTTRRTSVYFSSLSSNLMRARRTHFQCLTGDLVHRLVRPANGLVLIFIDVMLNVGVSTFVPGLINTASGMFGFLSFSSVLPLI